MNCPSCGKIPSYQLWLNNKLLSVFHVKWSATVIWAANGDNISCFPCFFTDDRNPRSWIFSKFLFVFKFSLLKNSLSSKIFSRRFAKLCATWTRAYTVVRHSTKLVCREALRENVPCVRQVFALIIVWLLIYFYIFFPQITVAWWVFFLVDDSAVEKTWNERNNI